MDQRRAGLDDLVIADVDMLGGSEQLLTDWRVVPNESAADATAFAAQSALAFQEQHPDYGQDPQQPVLPELGTPIDYDHDGRMDVLLHDIYGYFENWHVLLSKPGNQFKLLNTHIQRPFPLGTVPPPRLQYPDASVHLADVDGDGMADLIQCGSNGIDYDWFLNRWRPEGPGFDPVATPIEALRIYRCDAELHPVDIDSDGKVDLVVQALFENNGGVLQGATYVALSLVDAAANSWEIVDTKLPIAPIGPRGGVIFLDVNGDGLPDALETGFQNQQPLTFLSSGDGFLPPHPSLAAPMPEADRFIGLAAPIDYNGDGRQDLLLPLLTTGPVPSWTILQSQGELNGGTFLLVDPAIPFAAEIKEDGVTIADPHGPRVIDADGDGAQDLLLAIDKEFHLFKNALGDQDLLISVTDGMSARDPGAPGFVPGVQVSYAHLIDRAITQGQAPGSPEAEGQTYLSREDEAKGCAYPLRCVTGPRRVVSSYSVDKGGAAPRAFSLAYRDGRAHHLGRGFLGFGARILRDLDTGAGTVELYENTTFDADLQAYPLAAEVAHLWTYNPGRPGEPDPQRVELSFFDVLFQTVKTQGEKSYFTLPFLRRTRREQGTFPPGAGSKLTLLQYVRATASNDATMLGDTTTLVADYDLFGNIEAESTHTAGVDLTFQVKRSFVNDEDAWLLGLPTSQTECSSAAGVTQCRTDVRSYDDRGKVAAETTDSDGDDPAETHVALAFTYDVFGNITGTSADDAFGDHRLSCTYYDAQGMFPRAYRNPAGHLMQLRFDAGLGVRTVVTDPNGFSTRWAHDGFGRLSEERRPDGTKTSYLRTRTQEPGTGWTVRLETRTDGFEDDTVEYDSRGRAVRWWSQGVQTGALPVPRVMQEIRFDALGEHVAGRSVPASEATLPGSLLYDEYRHDSAGRLLRHTTPWKSQTDYSYDGRKVEVRDTLGQVTTIENDGLGRPVTITDTGHGKTVYGYGPFGGLRTVTDPGGAVTLTERDAYGRVKVLHDPDRGKTVSHYDGFGLPRWSLDAQGRKVSFSHDALGRQIGRSDPDGTSAWIWDEGPHARGKLSRVFGPDGTEEAYTYGAFGRLKETRLTLDGETLSTTLDYDAQGRVSRLSYPQGDGIEVLAVEHGYDPHGHLLSVRDAATNFAYWTLVEADGAGRAHVEKLGSSLTTTREYFDEKNRVKSISTTGLAGPVQALSYDYDVKLNLTRRTDALQQGKSEYFKYDTLDRLRCASFVDDFTCADPIVYLPNGNIDHKPGVGDYWYSQNHPHAVRSAGDAKYDYDGVGNQIARPGATVEYTARDLPRRFTLVPSGRTVDLSYDGDGHRVKKRAGGKTTVYFGDLYERTTDPSTGLVEHRYSIFSGERAIAVVSRSAGAASKTVYLHADHLGSTDALTSEGGALQEKRSYDAFGAKRSPVWGQAAIPPPSQAARQGFTGHDEDEELGLVNMKGRIYDPQLGRFLTPDPFVPSPTFSQSWNRYSYVLNNPLGYTDPSGFDEEPTATNPWVWKNVWWVPAMNVPAHGQEKDKEKEKGDKQDGEETGLTVVPVDVQTAGNTAPSVSPPPSSGQERSTGALAGEIGIGVAQGVGEFAFESAKFLVLSALTFGGYGTYSLGVGVWDGYQEDGILGALNGANPLYPIAQAAADVSIAADNDDPRAAAAAVTKAALLTLTLVVGEEEVAAGAGKSGASATADLGARAKEIHGSVGEATQRRTTIAVTHTAEGTRIVSSSENSLRPDQRSMLRPGEVEGIGPGHAEVTGIETARRMGLTPTHTAASRPICSSCALYLDQQGVRPASPLKE